MAYEVKNEGAGLGDSVSGLYVIESLKKIHKEIIYYSHNPKWMPPMDGVTHKHVREAPKGIPDFWSRYQMSLMKKENRKRNYANVCKIDGLEPSAPKLDKSYDKSKTENIVILAPYTTTPTRNWNLSNWLVLESLLLKMGIDVYMIGSGKVHLEQNYDAFKAKKAIGLNPDYILDLMLKSKLVIAGDTGITHFSNLYQIPTLALCSQISPYNLFYQTLGYAVTPDVKCYNCHFQFFNGYSKPCDIGCSALNSISPLNVIKVVQEILKNEYLPLMVGRREGLSKLNKIVRERFESPNIVEIGTIRKHDNVDGDGYSTFFFGWLNKDLGGKFYTVDIDPESIKISQNICSVLSDNINFHTGDGENFLKKFKEEIDVLYLDGFDSHIEQRDQAQHHAVKEFLAAENKLKENAVVAIDDAVNGKGDLLEGILLTKGFNLLFYSEANNQKIYSRIK